ncbi:hypothetical protein L291_1151 [Acinetobacter guillouiae MSP4-18]|nr:hypothetical protein L291_1151 [Acinetobacter guillouiae MSP4-18]
MLNLILLLYQISIHSEINHSRHLQDSPRIQAFNLQDGLN